MTGGGFVSVVLQNGDCEAVILSQGFVFVFMHHLKASTESPGCFVYSFGRLACYFACFTSW